MGMKIILILTASALLFAFQNCSNSGFNSGSAELDQNSEVDQKLAAAPFPFDAQINMISYMSCPTAAKYQSNGGPYFTFRLGGYDNTRFTISEGGITLSKPFLEYANKNYKSTQPEVTSETLASIIANHPEYKYAQPRVSLRSKNDLMSVVSYPDTSNPVLVPMLGPLSEPAYVNSVSKSLSKMVNSFPAPTENKKQFNTTFSLTGAGENQNLIRSAIQQNYYLTLEFAKNNEGNILSSNVFQPAANDPNRIYARGFAINFVKPSFPNSAPYSPEAAINPNLTIDQRAGITEYNLSSVSGAGPEIINSNWTCFNYSIVRRQDARDRADNTTRCPTQPYAEINQNELALVRKILPADEWEVNTQFRCVVPTLKTEQQGSCYLTTTANPTTEPVGIPIYQDYPNPTQFGGFATGIEYRFNTQPCGTYNQRRECVNFVTFCYRQN
jgi:hypothetical protein